MVTKMTHVSPPLDALPPASAPFAVKLRAAMDRSPRYNTQRALAKALGTDGSLVGKWLKGAVPSRRHLLQLPLLLDIPPDYFRVEPRGDRLEELAGEAAANKAVLADIVFRLDEIATRLTRLEDELARRPVGSTRRGARP